MPVSRPYYRGRSILLRRYIARGAPHIRIDISACAEIGAMNMSNQNSQNKNKQNSQNKNNQSTQNKNNQGSQNRSNNACND